MKPRFLLTSALTIGVSLIAAACRESPPGPSPPPRTGPVADPAISELIGGFSEAEMRATVEALEGFGSRTVGQVGNRQAAAYLHGRFSAIGGLTVDYQDAELRNVIATRPGTDPDAKAIYVAGAHYDSVAQMPDAAPGAMDDATGVSIVLEMARLASGANFRHAIVFACFNGEECGLLGSTSFVGQLKADGGQVGLYLNYDSTAYDPEGRLVLDVIASPAAADAKERLILHNRLYGIGFTLVENQHKCGGDYAPFAGAGYPTINTHQEVHGPHYHTANDRIGLVSFRYAVKNGQLGLSLLASLAR
jgi:hypothetical protein